MRYLLDTVQFHGKPILWWHKNRTESDFRGYYHWHQCCEILCVHEGQGSIIVNQKTYEVRRGMLFFFQPFQLHKVYANVSPSIPYVRTIIHFDPVFQAEGLRPFSSRHYLFNQLWQGKNAEQAYDLLAEFDHIERMIEMYNHAVSQGRGESDEEITMLLLQLMNFLAVVQQDNQFQAAEAGEPRSLRYAEIIMQWIEEHYAEEISLEDMSEALHLSKFYVSRVFRQETGSSLTDYVTARRIKQACRLLQTTSLSVERIGIESGLPNVSYFIRLFKKVVGTTPLKYRNHN